MELNKFNIEKLITWSNARMSKSEKRQAKVSLTFGALALIAALASPFEAFLLGVATVSVAKPVISYMKNAKKRIFAKHQLKRVTKELEKRGIHTTKLKLQKATTFVTYVEKKEYPLQTATAYTTFFKDRSEQIVALRQLRSEALSGTYSYFDCISDSIKEAQCKCVERQETEIIEGQEKVKKLLLEIKEG